MAPFSAANWRCVFASAAASAGPADSATPAETLSEFLGGVSGATRGRARTQRQDNGRLRDYKDDRCGQPSRQCGPADARHSRVAERRTRSDRRCSGAPREAQVRARRNVLLRLLAGSQAPGVHHNDGPPGARCQGALGALSHRQQDRLCRTVRVDHLDRNHLPRQQPVYCKLKVVA